MPDSIGLAVLSRYFDGTASPEERAATEAWIGTDPARRTAVAELHAAWLADARKLEAPFDAPRAWTRMASRLRSTGGDVAPVSRSHPWSRATIRALAAGVVLAVAGGGAIWLGFPGRAFESTTAEAPAMREYAAARGQRAIVRLLDGSEVTLNVDSRLRLPSTFGDARRDVYLEGEAYFSVVHDSERPFAVHTARGVTRDIGTRFAVRAYADEATEEVVVAEGAVAVATSPRAGEVMLRAGQGATLSAADSVTAPRDANLERELAWTRGRLELNRAPLADVARQLGRWYDLDVRIADPSLARREVTGSYGDEPIAHVLTVITAAVGARYEWRGRTVTISPATP